MTARLPINLMLVEDERIVAFDLKRQLQGFGYRVGAVVASGEQAIHQAATEKPDLVLMDIHLEGRMDGIEAAAEIRLRQRIPVVFLTAYAEDDTLRRALDSRPFGYLVKPCESRELHATIQMALARREDEVAVEQSEERLKLALDSASLGVLEWSPVSNRLKGDSYLGMLFEDRAQPFDEPWDAFIARVDVGDRERVREALNFMTGRRKSHLCRISHHRQRRTGAQHGGTRQGLWGQRRRSSRGRHPAGRHPAAQGRGIAAPVQRRLPRHGRGHRDHRCRAAGHRSQHCIFTHHRVCRGGDCRS